ncbi:hypothetical protein [Pantoea allii]|uniref:hypothetical protein n=1 Tax=Pantoea allii TaxID=574096 RepID=UPI000A230B69|nr:hypothetical protein [Pantoea allii]MBW1251185.1 hypothetical protein [Pantoea allii]MBW1260970.1 hypothetical protein [Pantoea allii]MBW1282379.1 hypothetical protein [Pantoea allii]ORM88647.1 hypothetical protein HA38_02140 [Pantoea allii]PBK00295.1 hypothetical protein CMR03_09695 [Pantoea allii]
MIRVAVLAEPDSTGRPPTGAAKNGRGNRLTSVKTGRAAPLAPGDLQQAKGRTLALALAIPALTLPIASSQ